MLTSKVVRLARAMARFGTAVAILLALDVLGFGQSQPDSNTASAALVRSIGVVKSINGSEITLSPDSGADMTFSIQDSTRMLRTAPGRTSLKDATPISLPDLQVGDRVFVKGTKSPDGKSIVALSAIVMKKADVATLQDQQRGEWRKQGVGGLVKAIDPAKGAIDISVTNFAGTKNITIHTTKTTTIRRYAVDSVKFDDAKPGTIDEIKVGDQLRARGKRSDDGTEVEAEEIVSGTFRNIAGTVSSVDPGQNSISVMDLLTKKTVTVKIGPDSQVKQLPAMLAQRIAMRLKGGGADAPPGGGAAGGPPTNAPANAAAGAAGGGVRSWGGGGGGGGRPGGTPDFQQMLARLPAATLADLHKGDAVMVVATEGSATSGPTVITMLSGVEPLLTDSRASTLLSAWNLGSGGAADAASQ